MEYVLIPENSLLLRYTSRFLIIFDIYINSLYHHLYVQQLSKEIYSLI